MQLIHCLHSVILEYHLILTDNGQSVRLWVKGFLFLMDQDCSDTTTVPR